MESGSLRECCQGLWSCAPPVYSALENLLCPTETRPVSYAKKDDDIGYRHNPLHNNLQVATAPVLAPPIFPLQPPSLQSLAAHQRLANRRHPNYSQYGVLRQLEHRDGPSGSSPRESCNEYAMVAQQPRRLPGHTTYLHTGWSHPEAPAPFHIAPFSPALLNMPQQPQQQQQQHDIEAPDPTRNLDHHHTHEQQRQLQCQTPGRHHSPDHGSAWPPEPLLPPHQPPAQPHLQPPLPPPPLQQQQQQLTGPHRAQQEQQQFEPPPSPLPLPLQQQQQQQVAASSPAAPGAGGEPHSPLPPLSSGAFMGPPVATPSSAALPLALGQPAQGALSPGQSLLPAEPGGALPGHNEVHFSELQFGQQVGEGGFGKVYYGRLRGQEVAIKLLAPDACMRANVVEEFRREVRTMSALPPHHNVIKLLGVCTAPPRLALVTEYCACGSLYGLLHSPSTYLTWSQIIYICLGAARGMAHLHRCRVLHRDLKSGNLLVDSALTVKVADFGLSKVYLDMATMTGGLGTFQWMAPEVLANQRYSEKADVYSFGIVMWECCARQVPFASAGLSGMQAAVAVMNKGLRPDIPHHTPPQLAELIRQCWAAVPAQRPSFEEICEQLDAILQHVRASS